MMTKSNLEALSVEGEGVSESVVTSDLVLKLQEWISDNDLVMEDSNGRVYENVVLDDFEGGEDYFYIRGVYDGVEKRGAVLVGDKKPVVEKFQDELKTGFYVDQGRERVLDEGFPPKEFAVYRDTRVEELSDLVQSRLLRVEEDLSLDEVCSRIEDVADRRDKKIEAHMRVGEESYTLHASNPLVLKDVSFESEVFTLTFSGQRANPSWRVELCRDPRVAFFELRDGFYLSKKFRDKDDRYEGIYLVKDERDIVGG